MVGGESRIIPFGCWAYGLCLRVRAGCLGFTAWSSGLPNFCCRGCARLYFNI